MSNIAIPSRRDLVFMIQDHLEQNIEPEELPTIHHFVRKCYIRECFLRQGVIAVGKIHKFQTFNIILDGDVTVFSEEFGVVRYKAPLTFVSMPGAKRVVYANVDTRWLTIHPTEKTDLKDIEEEFIAKDYGDPAIVESLRNLQLEVL